MTFRHPGDTQFGALPDTVSFSRGFSPAIFSGCPDTAPDTPGPWRASAYGSRCGVSAGSLWNCKLVDLGGSGKDGILVCSRCKAFFPCLRLA